MTYTCRKFVNFAVSGLYFTYLDSSTACTIVTFFTPNLISVILCFIGSLILIIRSPVYIQNSLAPIRFVISLPSYALSTGSKSPNASNTNSSHLAIQSSHNHTTSIPSKTHLCSMSSQYSLFICCYSTLAVSLTSSFLKK